jgi:hypothetical protein
LELPEISTIAGRVYEYVPRAELNLPDGLSLWDARYLLSHLMPAYERATAIYQTLALDVRDPQQAVDGWKVFKDEMMRSYGDGLPGYLTGAAGAVPGASAVLPALLAMKAAGAAYAGLIASLYWSAVTGFFGHVAFKDEDTRAYSIHQMVLEKKLTEAEAMAHAGWCYTAFKLIAKLDAIGGLRPLKKGSSGLGAIPAALVVAVVLVVIIIAGAIVLSRNLSEVNTLRAKTVEAKLEAMKETCANATDPAVRLKCAEGPTADDLSAGTFATEMSKALAATGSSLAKYLAIGVLGYLGIMMLPTLVGRTKAGVKEAVS